MIKDLTDKEVEDFAAGMETYSNDQLAIMEALALKERGEKVVIKQKTTSKENCLIVYIYDKDIKRMRIKYKAVI